MQLRKLFLDRPQDHNGAGVGQCRIADHLIPAIDGLRNTAAAPSGICKEIPEEPFREMRKRDRKRFPVGIYGKVDDILRSVVVFAGIHDADVVCIRGGFPFPGLGSVYADRGKTGAGRERLPPDHRMGSAYGDHAPKKFIQFVILL